MQILKQYRPLFQLLQYTAQQEITVGEASHLLMNKHQNRIGPAIQHILFAERLWQHYGGPTVLLNNRSLLEILSDPARATDSTGIFDHSMGGFYHPMARDTEHLMHPPVVQLVMPEITCHGTQYRAALIYHWDMQERQAITDMFAATDEAQTPPPELPKNLSANGRVYPSELHEAIGTQFRLSHALDAQQSVFAIEEKVQQGLTNYIAYGCIMLNPHRYIPYTDQIFEEEICFSEHNYQQLFDLDINKHAQVIQFMQPDGTFITKQQPLDPNFAHVMYTSKGLIRVAMGLSGMITRNPRILKTGLPHNTKLRTLVKPYEQTCYYIDI